MRTPEQIDQIKECITDPFAVENVLSDLDIAYLINLFELHEYDAIQGYKGKIHKNTGPITLDIKQYSTDPIISNVITKLEKIIGPFEITAAFFFKTDYPHIIHNDDTFELPDVYKGITLPLAIDSNNSRLPRLCFFNQFYFHGPAKFFNGSSNIDTYYNKCLYDYADVDGLVDTVFEDRENLLTHIKPKWLEGLSLHSTLEWKPGNALIFDSTRLHCASDFRQLGIRSKLGISIFTKQILHKDFLSKSKKIEYYLGKDKFRDVYFSTKEFPPAYNKIVAEYIKPDEYKSAELSLNTYYPNLKFKLNNLGYRSDTDFTVEQFKGKELVVCLGCTDTFGLHLENSKIWPTLLREQLPQYEVLNLGTIGAGADTVARLLVQLVQVLADEIKHVCILWPHPNRREFVSKEYTKIITSHDKTDIPFEEYWDFIDWKSNNYNHFKNYHLIKNLCDAHNISLFDLEIDRFDKKVSFDYSSPHFALGEKSHIALTNYYRKLILGEPTLFEELSNGK